MSDFPDPRDRNVIAFDIGVKTTGVAWRVHHSISTHTHDLVNTDGFRATAPVTMFRMIASWLTKNFPSDAVLVVLVEDYAYGGGFFNADQAEIVGMFKNWLMDADISFIPLPQASIHKAVLGSGKARKSDTIKAVRGHGLHPASSHQADAAAVLLAYDRLWPSPNTSMIRRSILCRSFPLGKAANLI